MIQMSIHQFLKREREFMSREAQPTPQRPSPLRGTQGSSLRSPAEVGENTRKHVERQLGAESISAGVSLESALGDGRREWYLAPFPLMSDELQVGQSPAWGRGWCGRLPPLCKQRRERLVGYSLLGCKELAKSCSLSW